MSRDLPGTGSKACVCGVSGMIESPDFATAARQIAGQATLLQARRQPDIFAPAPAPAPALLLLFLPRQSRHHKARLGCRLNAGGVEWVERHGCRESAVRAWMPVRRGPTERRRSEGTRRSRAKPGVRTLGYLGSFQVTRRRRNRSGVSQNQGKRLFTRVARQPNFSNNLPRAKKSGRYAERR